MSLLTLTLTPTGRRVLQAVCYEGIAVCLVGPALGWLFDAPGPSSLLLALVMASIALAWHGLFNLVFERWEARQTVKGRGWWRRIVHGLCFEVGLTLILVPLMAWWLHTTLWAAFLADLGVLLFFLVYGIAFTWAFDRLFGLPASAAGPARH